MGSAERRRQIMKILCRRRHETTENLAYHFGVSTRTVRRDIETLSLSEPIYTVAGRYGGGVYVVDGYYQDTPRFDQEELSLIKRLIEKGCAKEVITLSPYETTILKTMIKKQHI